MAKKITIIVPNEIFKKMSNLEKYLKTDTYSSVAAYGIEYLDWVIKDEQSKKNNLNEEYSNNKSESKDNGTINSTIEQYAMAKKITIVIPNETFEKMSNLKNYLNTDTYSSVVAYGIEYLSWIFNYEQRRLKEEYLYQKSKAKEKKVIESINKEYAIR